MQNQTQKCEALYWSHQRVIVYLRISLKQANRLKESDRIETFAFLQAGKSKA